MLLHYWPEQATADCKKSRTTTRRANPYDTHSAQQHPVATPDHRVRRCNHPCKQRCTPIKFGSRFLPPLLRVRLSTSRIASLKSRHGVPISSGFMRNKRSNRFTLFSFSTAKLPWSSPGRVEDSFVSKFSGIHVCPAANLICFVRSM